MFVSRMSQVNTLSLKPTSENNNPGNGTDVGIDTYCCTIVMSFHIPGHLHGHQYPMIAPLSRDKESVEHLQGVQFAWR